jgi:hypothetical protein
LFGDNLTEILLGGVEGDEPPPPQPERIKPNGMTRLPSVETTQKEALFTGSPLKRRQIRNVLS